MSKVEAYKEIIRLYFSKGLTEEMYNKLHDYLDDPDFLIACDAFFDENGNLDELDNSECDSDILFQEIKSDSRIKSQFVPKISFNKSRPVKEIFITAALVLIISTFALSIWSALYTGPSEKYTHQHPIQSNRILPGSDKAKIILDDGSVLDLEKLPKDTIINQGNFAIIKSKAGMITYQLKDNISPVERLAYNTIIIPKGGEYRLKLADGTVVWLNAMTTFRYPIVFEATKREVELKGEAFFDVAKRYIGGKRIPFIIQSGDQKLEVLGTTFNLQNYGERVVTTLVEGKVKLTYKEVSIGEKYLQPDDQAVFTKETKHYLQTKVDPFYFSAWKEGKFAFQNTPIEEVMDILARWYDVEIIFKDNIKDFNFSGAISRYEDLNKMLETIELLGGIHFELKGRRVYVMK